MLVRTSLTNVNRKKKKNIQPKCERLKSTIPYGWMLPISNYVPLICNERVALLGGFVFWFWPILTFVYPGLLGISWILGLFFPFFLQSVVWIHHIWLDTDLTCLPAVWKLLCCAFKMSYSWFALLFFFLSWWYAKATAFVSPPSVQDLTCWLSKTTTLAYVSIKLPQGAQRGKKKQRNSLFLKPCDHPWLFSSPCFLAKPLRCMI